MAIAPQRREKRSPFSIFYILVCRRYSLRVQSTEDENAYLLTYGVCGGPVPKIANGFDGRFPCLFSNTLMTMNTQTNSEGRILKKIKVQMRVFSHVVLAVNTQRTQRVDFTSSLDDMFAWVMNGPVFRGGQANLKTHATTVRSSLGSDSEYNPFELRRFLLEYLVLVIVLTFFVRAKCFQVDDSP